MSSFPSISFASDNHAGVHPDVMKWLNQVNQGPAPSYGVDSITAQATEKFKEEFGNDSEVYFLWNGTAANVLALKASLRSHQSVICSDVAHIYMDECGAPEAFTGSKLVPLPSVNGKITLEQVKRCFERVGDVQAVQPKVISLSQTTEYGTIYSLDEIKGFADLIHQHQGYLHLDGARITNAAVSIGSSLKKITKEVGVDILSFGGTKNGLMGAEAVVIFNPKLAEDFQYLRKQGLHLASKMRFISAQFLAYFENDLWKKNAERANKMAKLLEQKLKSHQGKISITQPVQANVVFATLPKAMIATLQKDFYFYVWNEETNEVRLMCSFETTETQIEKFSSAIATWADKHPNA